MLERRVVQPEAEKADGEEAGKEAEKKEAQEKEAGEEAEREAGEEAEKKEGEEAAAAASPVRTEWLVKFSDEDEVWLFLCLGVCSRALAGFGGRGGEGGRRW